MIAPFDLFWTEADGSMIWLEAAEDLDRAKARLLAIGASKPGKYVIFSRTTGNKLSVDINSRGELTTRTT